jgi:hypothetical protein
MLPTDSEFTLLYFSYVALFVYLIFRYFTTKKKFYYFNLVVYLMYSFFMIYIFLDENNFKGGSSLSVLFYGFLFVIIQIVVMIIASIVSFIRRK